jgi:hypothetical protein
MTTHWLALPDDERECPLLRVNAWNQITHDAGLMLTIADDDGINAEWAVAPKGDGLPGEVAWGLALWVPVPPRTRRARLLEARHDHEINRLLSVVCDGWTISRDELFSLACGTLDAPAIAALRNVCARVQAIACAPARSLRDAPAQPTAQPC